MLTRCPRCATTFRVTPEQLKARHGRVRCGHCQDVFNALDTLIDAAPHPASAPTAQTPIAEEATSEISAFPRTTDDSAEESVATPADEENSTPPEAATDAGGKEGTASAEEDAAPAGVAAKPAETFTADEHELIAPPGQPSAVPELEPLLHEKPRKRAWPWVVGGVGAALILLFQAAIHFRTEIAILYPAAKPMLSAACAPLGCEVSLPRKSELVGIETSSLAPEVAGKLTLSATLKNRAPFTQQYPDLELTLTDTADKALVRRVLAPAEYLPPKTDVASGFAAGAEIAVNLVVDAPGLPAAGYQLYLFYP